MKKQKLLCVLLTAVFLLTQVTGVLQAEVASNTPTAAKTAGNVYSDPNNTMLGNSNSNQQSLSGATDSLANYYINYWKDNSWD